jgi:hypothetical protein
VILSWEGWQSVLRWRPTSSSVGPLTGGAMNPARWFGPAVASGHFDNWYVWWVGPLIGAIVGAVIFRYLLEGEAEPDVTPATAEG